MRCCQLRALHDLIRHVWTFLCQIYALVTDSAHRARVFTLLLVLHIQHVVLVSGVCRFKRSLLIFSRNCLTITHVVRRLITSIRANFVQGNYCVSKMDLLLLHLLPLAKYYNRVCSAIIFTSLNSTINRTQAVISLNALCTLVFRMTIRRGSALTAISSWHSLDYNTVGAFISSTHFLRREVFGLALVLGFGLMPVCRTSQVNSRPSFAHLWQFLSTWISRSASKNRVVILWLG